MVLCLVDWLVGCLVGWLVGWLVISCEEEYTYHISHNKWTVHVYPGLEIELETFTATPTLRVYRL